MSGEQKESRATVLSAMKSSGVGGKLKQELLDEVDKFVTITRTIGADLTGGRDAAEDSPPRTGPAPHGRTEMHRSG